MAYTTLGQVSEFNYHKNPKQTIQRFHQLLNDALAIGHYIDREAACGRHLKSLVHLKDLPESDQDAKACWDHLHLPTLFDSFSLTPPSFQPATTFGNPAAVAAELQQSDLKKPRTRVALNGHHMKFQATLIEGQTFYLPTGICRLRNGWRLFIRHAEGVWSDEVEDTPGNLIEESLREAWIYFVSQVRVLTPRKERLAPVTLQRCYTGVEGGTFLIGNRDGRWYFQLVYRQKKQRGQRFSLTVRYWREDTLTDASLRSALLKLAAIDAYWRNISNEDTSNNVFINEDTVIPLAFWPAEPVIPLAADDLYYEVENRVEIR